MFDMNGEKNEIYFRAGLVVKLKELWDREVENLELFLEMIESFPVVDKTPSDQPEYLDEEYWKKLPNHKIEGVLRLVSSNVLEAVKIAQGKRKRKFFLVFVKRNRTSLPPPPTSFYENIFLNSGEMVTLFEMIDIFHQHIF